MTLKTQISEDLRAAMKAKDLFSLNVLRVLKAEIERNEQTADGKIEYTDGQVSNLSKKFIQNVNETTKDAAEIAILEKYLLQPLQESEIRAEAIKIKESGNLTGMKDMKKIMSHFESNYEGRYDGKVLSSIAKEVL